MKGIYSITNQINGKRYYGQSIDIERRWKEEHRGLTNVHLKRSFNKYGFDNFDFEIVHEFKHEDIRFFDALEQTAILLGNTTDSKNGYNKTHGGGACKMTDDTKRKISEGQKGKVLSEETKRKIKESNLKRSFDKYKDAKSVYCIEQDKFYPSLHNASNQTGIHRASIIRACSGKQKTAGGYHWKYVKE